MEQRILELLSEVEAGLQMHGGAIELVGITPDHVVQLRFKGACVGCVAADMTLEYGIKELLMLQVPEVEDVVAVNTEAPDHEPPAVALHAAD